MRIAIRIAGTLLRHIEEDLLRVHPHAAERVGFVFTDMTITSDGQALVIVKEYKSLPDQEYILDPSVGACISRDSIRAIRQACMDRGDGAFHIHMHPRGRPLRFSGDDLKDLPNLVQSLQVIAPKQAHGLIVFNDVAARGAVWLPGEELPRIADSVTSVGFPIRSYAWRPTV